MFWGGSWLLTAKLRLCANDVKKRPSELCHAAQGYIADVSLKGVYIYIFPNVIRVVQQVGSNIGYAGIQTGEYVLCFTIWLYSTPYMHTSKYFEYVEAQYSYCHIQIEGACFVPGTIKHSGVFSPHAAPWRISNVLVQGFQKVMHPTMTTQLMLNILLFR